jgi:hypothetical protein
MSEWKAYRIRFPGSPAGEFPEGRVLDRLYHVTHVGGARRILADGELKAGLVYDESKLKKSRIAVTWLSANTWAYGSIYGNVEFAFSWKKHAAGKKFYWVEAMPSYRPDAYRILLSDREVKSKYVQRYDPATEKGPLRKRGGKWYWNGDCTSEFLIEGNIPLADCIEFDFIAHHAQLCSVDGRSCAYRGSQGHAAAGPVLGVLLGNGLHTIDHVLKKDDAKEKLSFAVDTGVRGILRDLRSKAQRFGGVIRSAESRKAVMRGALALYGSGQTDAARELLALLKSRDTFDDALTDVVNEHFGVKGWKIE